MMPLKVMHSTPAARQTSPFSRHTRYGLRNRAAASTVQPGGQLAGRGAQRRTGAALAARCISCSRATALLPNVIIAAPKVLSNARQDLAERASENRLATAGLKFRHHADTLAPGQVEDGCRWEIYIGTEQCAGDRDGRSLKARCTVLRALASGPRLALGGDLISIKSRI